MIFRCARPFRAALILLALGGSHPAHAEWNALERLRQTGALVTASAYDLDGGVVLQKLGADVRLAPASLTKLAVTAASLEHWTPDKVFLTRVYATGAVRNGEVEGDLILLGAGDPTLEYRSLLELAAQVKSAGIKLVRGKVIVDLQPFASVECETKDRCDALLRSDTAYNAPLAAVGVDYGNWCINVQPTRAGDDAKIRGCGVARLPLEIQGEIKTLGAKGKQTFWVERITRGGVDELRVGGAIPEGPGQRVYRAMSDSALGVSQLLRQTLLEIGVTVQGAAGVARDAPLPPDAQPVAQTEGLLLREQLGRMLRFSNNYIADVLTLDLAADFSSGVSGPTRLADAGRVLSGLIAENFEPAHRRKAGPPPLFSGSGLTPENRLSADDLISLLSHQYHNARLFPAFYGGLVVPRQAPFAFLRQGNAAWLDRVALKTGTMDQPFSVCGIAGYLRKKTGGWIAFAVIVNGSERLRHVPLYKAMEAARTDVEALLASH